MKISKTCLFGAVFFCAILSLAQLPSTVPLATREHQPPAPLNTGEAWIFKIGNRQYEARMTRAQVLATPDWTPAAALPLSLARVEEIARAQLRKIVSDEPGWELVELNLRRLRDEPGSKWYYLVKLKPAKPVTDPISNSFSLPISFAGEPGQVTLR